MAFSFGSFAGGAAEGITRGLDAAGKLRQLQDAARVRAARSALGRSYASDIPMGDGVPPPPVTPPGPGVASMPKLGNTSPDPMMGPPPAPMTPPANDMSGMPSGGAPLPPAPLPPPVAAPPMPDPNMPATGAGPATGGGGAPLSGVAAPVDNGGATNPQGQLTSTITDANNTIKAIAHAVKQANPNIDPETLFEATHQHIDQMKGVRNEVKDYMKFQTDNAALQLKQDQMAQRSKDIIQKLLSGEKNTETRAEAQRYVADQNRGGREYGADRREEGQKYAADRGVDRANIGANATVTRTQMNNDTQRFIQDAHDKTRVYDTRLQQYVKIVTANTGDESRVDAGTARYGGTPPVRQRLNPLPIPGAPPKTYLDGQGNPVATPPTPGTAPRRATSGQPPQAALNKIPEGQQATYPNGQTWQRVNGVASQVK